MALYIGGIDRSQSRRKAPVSPASAWTPFHLGDALLAYWDAEASASLSLAGSSVTTWADCKNGHAPTQTLAGSKPLWSATGFNGRPAVIFDGVDDFLSLESQPLGLGAAEREIWFLGSQSSPDAAATNGTPFAYGGTISNANFIQRSQIGGVSRARGATGAGGTTIS